MKVNVSRRFFAIPPRKDGILLMDNSCMPPSLLRSGSTSASDSNVGATTVRATLTANVLLIYEMEQQSGAGVGGVNMEPSLLIVLERCIAELVDSTPFLPYPFVVRSDMASYYFSCFAEADRADWVMAVASSSHELLLARVQRQHDRLDEQFALKFTSSLPRMFSFLNTKSRESRLLSEAKSVKTATAGDQMVDAASCSAENFSVLYTGVVDKRFTFGGITSPLVVAGEVMAEPKLTLRVAPQLLKSVIGTLEYLLDKFTGIYYLPSEWNSVRSLHIAELDLLLDKARQTEAFLSALQGPCFKSSLMKERSEFAFLPTNLHLQRFAVAAATPSSSVSDKSHDDDICRRDIFTCGAFATCCEKGYDKSFKELVHELGTGSGMDGLAMMNDGPWKPVLETLRQFEVVRLKLSKLRNDWKPFADMDHAIEEEGTRFADESKKLQARLRSLVDQPFIRMFVDKVVGWHDRYSSLVPNERDPAAGIENVFVQLDDLEADLVCLVTKVQNCSRCIASSAPTDSRTVVEQWLLQLYNNGLSVLHRLNSLYVTCLHCFLFSLIHRFSMTSAIRAVYQLFYRTNAVLSQALTAVAAVLTNACWQLTDEDIKVKSRTWSSCGALLVVTSYLSCYQLEKSMMEEADAALNFIEQRCRFRLVKGFAGAPTCAPLVEGDLSSVEVTISVPLQKWDHFSVDLRQGKWFRVSPVMLNVGINYEQMIAVKLLNCVLEEELNQRALAKMKDYFERFEVAASREQADLARNLLLRVDRELGVHRWKNVDLLHASVDFALACHGHVIVCCKSGKDRTSMAVTYGEMLLLKDRYHLPEDQCHNILNQLRVNGTRMENAYKNIGARRYAFNAFQLTVLPPSYRPPNGSFGGLLT